MKETVTNRIVNGCEQLETFLRCVHKSDIFNDTWHLAINIPIGHHPLDSVLTHLFYTWIPFTRVHIILFQLSTLNGLSIHCLSKWLYFTKAKASQGGRRWGVLSTNVYGDVPLIWSQNVSSGITTTPVFMNIWNKEGSVFKFSKLVENLAQFYELLRQIFYM